MTTTLPRSCARVSGGELSQATAPLSSGMGPSSGRIGGGSAALTFDSAGFGAPSAWIRCSSAVAVLTKENFARRLVSQPSAMATTPMITAAPSARRIQRSKRRECFTVENTFFPAKSAIASEVAAPSAYDNNKNEERAPGPWIAAPVKIKPRIGPAQGAHSRPVEIPSRKDLLTLVSVVGP